ncbi:MAG: xanthine dehydrogenase family protein [Spirochaetales bacterium]|nr:xanthine dehydrogenase family protein [Spirochaetales bacterium]
MNIREEAVKTLRGKIEFLEDIRFPSLLNTYVLCSPIYTGTFEILAIPPLPDGYYCITAADIPGSNTLSCFDGTMPVLAAETIHYQGEPICILIGEKEEKLLELAQLVDIGYNEESPRLSIEHPDNETIADSFSFSRGNVHQVFKNNKSILEEEYSVGFQEYVFLEPQSSVAIYGEKNLSVYCPTKNAFHIRDNLASLLDIPAVKITIIVPDSVQDPGDKEALPMIISSLAGLCAFVTKKNVRVTLDNTIKRYPTIIKHKTAIGPNGELLAAKVSLVTDCGAYPSISPHLFHRAIYTLLGAYDFETYEIQAATVRTNKAPYTRFLNGGAVEAFFAIELHVTHAARLAGVNPAEFKKKHLQTESKTKKPGNTDTASAITSCIDTVITQSDFSRKYRAYEALRGSIPFPHFQYPIRGIGFSTAFFGFDFIDESRADEKHSIRLTFEKNTLTIYSSATEMGQGLKYLFSSIAAKELNLKPEQISIAPVNTSVNPNSGPIYETHAVTEIGKLIEDGCRKLKKKMGKSRKPVTIIHTVRKKKTVSPRQLFEKADAGTLSWCAMVIEIEIDPATLVVEIPGIWVALESGIIIDREIAQIHIEKEIASALEMLHHSSFPHGHKYRVYKKIPPIHISFSEKHYAQGPAGGKGIGELPSLPVAPAYIAAVSQAINHEINFFPFSPTHIEDIVESE